MTSATYYKDSPPAPLQIFWGSNGALIDLSDPLWTFALEVTQFGVAGVLFTKTTGFTGYVGDDDDDVANLNVSWSQVANEELDTLAAGKYVVKIVASHPTLQDETLFGDIVIRENAPNYGYCEVPDLLIGDIKISSRLNQYDYINSAADEMNAKIGQVYQLPLDLTDAAPFVAPLLKKINQFLATGRLIMALGQGEEWMTTHAYARELLKEGKAELENIFCGSTPLTGCPRLAGSFRSNAPTVSNIDTASAVETFNAFVNGDANAYWGAGL